MLSHTSVDTIGIKDIFHENLWRSFHICCQIDGIRNSLKFKKKNTKFWGRCDLFVVGITGSWLCYADIQEHFLHFEILTDALLQMLWEVLRFKILIYFKTWWRHHRQCREYSSLFHDFISTNMFFQNHIYASGVLHCHEVNQHTTSEVYNDT